MLEAPDHPHPWTTLTPYPPSLGPPGTVETMPKKEPDPVADALAVQGNLHAMRSTLHRVKVRAVRRLTSLTEVMSRVC